MGQGAKLGEYINIFVVKMNSNLNLNFYLVFAIGQKEAIISLKIGKKKKLPLFTQKIQGNELKSFTSKKRICQVFKGNVKLLKSSIKQWQTKR